MLTLALAMLTAPAQAEDVLLLWDVEDQDTPALVTALEAAGFSVALAEVPEFQWDGTNPSLDGHRTVVHLNGAESAWNGQGAWQLEMPVAGQQALAAYVRAGGGFIHSEWSAYEIDNGWLAAMTDLVLLRRETAWSDETYTLVEGHQSHPLWADLPSSFSVIGSHNSGPAATFDTQPATVIATHEHGAAVVVRELDAGHIVGFSHTGNYYTGPLTDANAQQLYVNAVRWTMDCDLDKDGDPAIGICGGADCDDMDPGRSTLASERCNGIDNDCNGVVDLPDPIDGDTWYADGDADGYGAPGASMLACDQPDGYVSDGTDCVDDDPDINPGEEEIPYDGLDNDCLDGDLCDVDGDGADAPECNGDDCLDTDANVYPNAEEIWYDDVDQDCDGNDDDKDLDGYDHPEDCDDDNADVNPGVEEVQGDDIDNDCDGKVDGCGCQAGPAGGVWLLPGLLAILTLRRRRRT